MMTLLIVLTAVCVLYLAIIFCLILSGTRSQPDNHADTLLILGARVKGTPARPSQSLKERLDAALPYLFANRATTIIVCGGQGPDESDTEANVMADYLITRGIERKRLIKEDTSTRTKENLLNAMAKRELGKTVIVTNDFHLYRAKLLAKRLGINRVSGIPAPSRNPSTVLMYAREILALAYGFLADW